MSTQPSYYLADFDGTEPALYSTPDLARAHVEDLARVDCTTGAPSFDWMPEHDGVTELVWTESDSDRPLTSTSGRVTTLRVDADAPAPTVEA